MQFKIKFKKYVLKMLFVTLALMLVLLYLVNGFGQVLNSLSLSFQLNFLIMLFSVFAILAVIAFLIREWQKNNFFSVFACMLILSGAFGNLIDRIRFGYVIDWILLFQLSIFNISDIAIGAGIIILLLTQRPKSGTQ